MILISKHPTRLWRLLMLWVFLLESVPPVMAQEITDLVWIDASTDTKLRNLELEQDTINLRGDASQQQQQLTIRADVSTTDNIDYVQFDWDNGSESRRESRFPYYLGGDILLDDKTTIDANPVDYFRVGTFPLTVSVYDNTGSIVSTRSVRITMVDENDDDGDDEDAEDEDDNNLVVDSTVSGGPSDVPAYMASTKGAVQGELKQWHKISIGFLGPETSERNQDNNPFTDFRLDVTFVHTATGESLLVPGYYACNGNAANTGSDSGNVWLAHFRPPQLGEWSYEATLWQGPNVALDDEVDKTPFWDDDVSGTFVIEESDKNDGVDLRGKGRLQYVGKHHLRFANGEYFLKAGADSPENFLAYEEFDNTPNYKQRRKSWEPHVSDYQNGDPTWANGRGKGIIGAVNYLSSKGMNVFSFLSMNIQGDDRNVFPYLSSDSADYDRIDCSKTAQWEILFDHAETKGMYLHFKTQERENDQLLDGGALGNQRKLYYRELVARFGHHLALNWNLGEENTNTDAQRKAFSDYFKEIDPYDSPIVVHTWPNQQEQIYGPLLGHDTFDGVSIQTSPGNGFAEALKWVTRSKESGRPWIVCHDEQAPATDGVVPDSVDPDHDVIRKNVLWSNFLAGGGGVEYYFGYAHAHSDLTLQDFRSRANMWDQSRYALDFFRMVPYWDMKNANQLVANGNWCLIDSEDGSNIVLYLPDGGEVTVDMTGDSVKSGSYQVLWFDPLRGGDMQIGSVESISSGTISSIGEAPYNPDQDWALLLCTDCLNSDTVILTPPPTAVPTAIPTTDPTAMPTISPTVRPTLSQTVRPTISPTLRPFADPTSSPTIAPTRRPTMVPTKRPTGVTIFNPVATPTSSPMGAPTFNPVATPTSSPTGAPTLNPVTAPTDLPTKAPSKSPTGSSATPQTVKPVLDPTATELSAPDPTGSNIPKPSSAAPVLMSTAAPIDTTTLAPISTRSSGASYLHGGIIPLVVTAYVLMINI